MDLDLDDLGLGNAPVNKPAPRRSKFLPKSGKLIPKPEPESQPSILLTEPSNKQEVDIELPQAQSSIDDVIESKPDEKMSMATKEEEMKEDHMDIDKDEEDQVVREIDVFYTPSLLDTNAQLYVMQYPLRPAWRPYELDEKCKEVRIKPKSGKVEVELSLDTTGNYDNDAYSNYRLTKQTLSSWRSPLKTSYAVGVLTGNKLHLNPVHAVVQLRPSMEHLTSGGSKKNSATGNVEGAINSNEIPEVKAESSSKKPGKMEMSSSAQVDAEESWISLDYHGMHSGDSSLAMRYRLKMNSQESSGIQFSMSPYEYVNSLCPMSSIENDRDRSLSRRFLLSLPLEDRFKKWLSEGHQLNRFLNLKYLAPDNSDEEVLDVLQRYACLVQGLWVPKSSLLQIKNPLARNYVLSLFTNKVVICRKDLNEQLQKEAEGYLNLFAVYKSSLNEWKFKEATDESFLKSYPDIVRMQAKYWEDQKKEIEQSLQKHRSGHPVKVFSKPGMTTVPKTSDSAEGAKINVNGKPSTKPITMSDKTQEALSKELEAFLRRHNVCSLEMICEGLKEQLKADTFTRSELHFVLDQIAVKVGDVYVLKSLGDPVLDPLRHVVIDLFYTKPNSKVKKADITEAAKLKLGRDINQKEYTQVMYQLCVSSGSAWYLKGGNDNSKLNSLDIHNDSKSQIIQQKE